MIAMGTSSMRKGSGHIGWTEQEQRGIGLEDYIIYELHTGTFTPEGTFEGIISKLPHSKQFVGVRTVLVRSISDPLGRAGDQFRRFPIDDAHYWLAEYHIDSLRLDVRAIPAIAVHVEGSDRPLLFFARHQRNSAKPPRFCI